MKQEHENGASMGVSKIMLTISTSALARLILHLPVEAEQSTALEFGKKFEQAYSSACYFEYKMDGVNFSHARVDVERFLRVVQADFNASDQARARTMARSFLQARIVGLTPKTRFYQIIKDHYIAAKPDLEWGGRYFEFKTCPLDKYARLQARIFALACSVKSIVLAGFDNNEARVTHVRAAKKEYIERMANKYIVNFAPSKDTAMRFHKPMKLNAYEFDDDYEDFEDDEDFFMHDYNNRVISR